MEKIELTHHEIEEIKDEVVFRTKTTLCLKELKIQMERLNPIAIKTQLFFQWFCIGGLLIAIIFRR